MLGCGRGAPHGLPRKTSHTTSGAEMVATALLPDQEQLTTLPRQGGLPRFPGSAPRIDGGGSADSTRAAYTFRVQLGEQQQEIGA